MEQVTVDIMEVTKGTLWVSTFPDGSPAGSIAKEDHRYLATRLRGVSQSKEFYSLHRAFQFLQGWED